MHVMTSIDTPIIIEDRRHQDLTGMRLTQEKTGIPNTAVDMRRNLTIDIFHLEGATLIPTRNIAPDLDMKSSQDQVQVITFARLLQDPPGAPGRDRPVH